MRTAPALVATLLLAIAPAAASAQRSPADRIGTALDVLPPGQSGAVPPGAHAADQVELFDALTPLRGNVTADDVRRHFKSAAFGTPGMPGTREATPNRRVRIVRDDYGVPHLFARRRADVMWGMGWITAGDRGTFNEAIRSPGRIAAVGVPGYDALALAADLRRFTPTRRTERFLARERRVLRRGGARGRRALRDVLAYLRGYNARLRRQADPPRPWTVRDVVAAGALLAQQVGSGGGDEVRRSALLSALQQRLGPAAGLAAWNDLRLAQDPEHPATVARAFRYDPARAGVGPGSRIVDAGSYRPASGAAAATPARASWASSALAVAGARSVTGRPLAVMGPQLKFYYPEIFHEVDVHGGGIDARGAVFPGVGMYVIVGRAGSYAWSPTTSNSDISDEFLVRLCEPGGGTPTRASAHYRHRGRCRAMGRFDAGRLEAGGGEPACRLRFRTTVHGPVTGTATVGGRPYAVARRTSTRGRNAGGFVSLMELNEGRARTGRDFVRVMSRFELTQNWIYAGARDIAFFSSGRLPLRARDTTPGLPTLGDGRHEWRGWLSARAHPQAVNPASGLILNWNNKPAAGFAAADNVWAQGSVHRVGLFDGLPQRSRLEDVVAVMNRAATEDLRATRLWPLVREVLGADAPDARTARAAELLDAYAAGGGVRLDADLDGRLDDPGAAVLDAAFVPIAKTILAPVLGELATGDGPGTLASLQKIDDAPVTDPSAYGEGWYSYVDKDLRAVLGRPVRGWSRRYCGGGDLAACRASLWAALDEAADRLAAAQGNDPAAWRADANAERIRFAPGVLTATMRWTNRPTFQQVVALGP